MPTSALRSVKIVVAGGFGVGKTTFVRSTSEIRPLSTEAPMTTLSAATDDTSHTGSKTTTTVALDFGRRTIDDDVVLYLFGTPGQKRFGFMWDNLARGAIGAIVLADTRRLRDCFPSLDFFEERGIPFVLAVNRFDDAPEYSSGDMRDALGLRPEIPLIRLDARDEQSSTAALIELIEYRLRRQPTPA
ncbi:GTP-binding protein [Streptomyces sp. SBT349]|uniref:GTP-binding protein n=1 Tax=Streptomyces sp. SBT349 TaxID=1580539 RepID=UPI00066D57F3|nr:ATP/GTP-binding protein [Streptomyces sp. SBT349]